MYVATLYHILQHEFLSLGLPFASLPSFLCSHLLHQLKTFARGIPYRCTKCYIDRTKKARFFNNLNNGAKARRMKNNLINFCKRRWVFLALACESARCVFVSVLPFLKPNCSFPLLCVGIHIFCCGRFFVHLRVWARKISFYAFVSML